MKHISFRIRKNHRAFLIPVSLILAVSVSSFGFAPGLPGLVTACAATAVSNNHTCETLEEFTDFLSGCRKKALTSFDVTCTGELFTQLKENEFYLLHRTEVLAQLADRDMSYYDDGRMNYKNVSYTASPAYSCEDMAQVQEAAASCFGQQINTFKLVCSEELYRTLFDDGYLFHVAARNGKKNIDYTGYGSTCVIEVNSASAFTFPYLYAKDGTEYLDALASFHQQGKTDFTIITDPLFLADLLKDDNKELYRLQALGGVNSFSYTYYEKSGIVEYTGTTFAGVPRLLCENREAVIATIRQAGMEGVTDFDLILEQDLFNDLMEDEEKNLPLLAREAGMTGYATWHANHSLCVLGFTDAVIVSDMTQQETLEDAAGFISQYRHSGSDTITLFCSGELYNLLLNGTEYPQAQEITGSMFYLNDLLRENEVNDYYYSHSDLTNIITVSQIRYYPGEQILKALENQTLEQLEARLYETYEAAAQIAADALTYADEAGAADDREKQMLTAKYINDALCERITYLADETSEENDTAVGALLNGLADCDGYSDAFYLTGSLAGLEVRCQHGDTYAEPDNHSDMTHMWNIMKIGDDWMAVDVTWNDLDPEEDDKGFYSYRYFLSGEDRLCKTHFWNHQVSPPIARETDMNLRPRKEYIIHSWEDISPAARDITGSFMTQAELYIYTDQAEEYEDELFRLLHETGAGDILYSRDEKTGCLSLKSIAY